jgi:hypothetical protein
MSQKNFMIVVAFLVVFSILTISANLSYKNSLVVDKQRVQSLNVEATAYTNLKLLDNSTNNLKQTLSKVSKVINANSVSWNKDIVNLKYNSIEKNMLDRVMQTFINQGHTIKEFKIEKLPDGFSLYVGVKP